MAKLFAMEDAELGGEVVETEAPAEAVDVSALDAEMEEGLPEIAEGATNVEEGTAATDQLEEVAEVVEESVDSGEGMTATEARAIRIAVEAIAARINYNPKSMYALYSTENFKSQSSRMANTQIALEGIQDFLKTLWEKIKAAVTWVINKVKEFYAKHVSGLGRVTKALEASKKRVTALKGNIAEQRIKAPGGLKSAFPSSTTLTTDVIEGYIKVHQNETAGIKTVGFADVIQVVGEIAAAKQADIKAVFKAPAGLMSEATPGINGSVTKFEVNEQEYTLKITVERGTDKSEKDAEISVASKGDMSTLINSCSKLITETKAIPKVLTDFQSKFNTESSKLDKIFNSAEKAYKEESGKEGADKEKLTAGFSEMKKQLKLVNTAATTISNHAAVIGGLNVKLAFAVVSFVALCCKQYKETKV